MFAALVLAGVVLRPIALDDPVLDVRVADIDLDGHEDVVAITQKELLLFRGTAKGLETTPAVRRPAPALTVVGRGLLGIVREGRYRTISNPLKEWTEGEPAFASLLGALGTGEPALVSAPGDLDGDGRDDVVLATPDGMRAGAFRLPVTPRANLEIKDNETFAVRYEIPVPVIGRWRATGRQVLFVGRDAIVAFEGGKEVERVPLPPPPEGEDPQSIARRHILVRDVDADGRLDMIVVQAKGAMRLFSVFEGVAAYFRGAVYDFEKKRFRAPSVRKVPGALLRPALVDVDGDRDLDLILSTVQTSGLGAVTGKAPGVSYLFLFEDGDFSRRPGWTYKTFVPMANLGVVPHSPVTFLPDLDGNGFGELIDQSNGVLLAEAAAKGSFNILKFEKFPSTGAPAVGRQRAAVPGETGLLVVEVKR
ncbi:MAG: hypothetical protein O7E54_04645 [Planctomycetota bacterium]|nr:hypothetical protein [Planctomycetota bacterium]